MSTTKIVMDGIHRLDEWAKIRAALPDDSIVLEPARPPGEVAALPDLTPEEKRIFPLLDGTRTLGEVVDVARLGEFECYMALFRLHALGIARAKGSARPSRRAAS